MSSPPSETRKLESKIAQLKSQLAKMQAELDLLLSATENNSTPADLSTSINNFSPSSEKIRLFRELFRGRDDVYARRFESAKTGKSGYQPACAHEWKRGICHKPQVKCIDCEHRSFWVVTDEVIRQHLLGEIPAESPGGSSKPFVVGLYPLLTNETCWFLVSDFDKQNWLLDAGAFLETCREECIPAYLERSRSGNGGHIWIFFSEPIPARIARNLGVALMTKTLDRRPDLGLDSFDRFFPNQDTMPKGGMGNLIALPLQKNARERNNSEFLDEAMDPYADQWAFLASVEKLDRSFVESYVQRATFHKELLPVFHNDTEGEIEKEPWKSPSRIRYPVIGESLPANIEVVLANQIFIASAALPAILQNRILRLASFANPAFYQAQAMRLPTWNKPRILYCYEQFPQHIALPIGCLDDLKGLLAHYGVVPDIEDKRNRGESIDVQFLGKLHAEQQQAAEALLQEDNGILSATTAFGKTVVALWLIAQRNTNTLILVHRKQLMEQWVERISQFLDIAVDEVGRFGGGKKLRTGALDVAVIQSVCRKGQVQEWIRDYGQVIVDECHHISAYSFEQAIRQSDARYKVGLSATMTRKDGQQPIVFMNLGKIRYTVNACKQASERKFEHRVIVRPTNFTVDHPEEAGGNIQDLFRGLWSNEARNRLIVNDALEASHSGRQILILSERTEHLEVLRKLLEEQVTHLFVLKGGLGKKQLKKIDEALRAVEDNESRLILATGRYLGEGFDLPMLDTLFLTFPVSWRGTLAQYAGRIHRDYHSKTEVRIYDYVDQNIPVLSRMHGKRLKGYASLGYEVVR